VNIRRIRMKGEKRNTEPVRKMDEERQRDINIKKDIGKGKGRESGKLSGKHRGERIARE
jgi:hypothetical protein